MRLALLIFVAACGGIQPMADASLCDMAGDWRVDISWYDTCRAQANTGEWFLQPNVDVVVNGIHDQTYIVDWYVPDGTSGGAVLDVPSCDATFYVGTTHDELLTFKLHRDGATISGTGTISAVCGLSIFTASGAVFPQTTWENL